MKATINSAQRVLRVLSKKHLHAYAQHLVGQRAYDANAFGFGCFHQPFTKRRFQAVRDGFEGFQTFRCQHRIFQTEMMILASEIARSGQPVQAVDAELGLFGQPAIHFVGHFVLVHEHADKKGNRFRKALVEPGECLPADFIKPINIGGSHVTSHA